MKNLRIMLVDDHPLLMEGTRGVIERDPHCEVCAMTESGRAALDLATRHQPDVVVLDLTLADSDGLTVARQLLQADPDLGVVIYSGRRPEEVVEALFKSGVKSVISKTDSPETLLAAIKAAGEHKVFITPAIGEILFRRGTEESAPAAHITHQEREVLRLVAAGHSNKEVAEVLEISPRTAETHRAAVMHKLGATSLAGLVRYAIRNALIEA